MTSNKPIHVTSWEKLINVDIVDDYEQGKQLVPPVIVSTDPHEIPFLETSSSHIPDISVKSIGDLKSFTDSLIKKKEYLNSEILILLVFSISDEKQKDKAFRLPSHLQDFDDKYLHSILKSEIEFLEFKASEGTSETLFLGKTGLFRSVSIVGLGSCENLNTLKLSKVADAIKKIVVKQHKAEAVNLVFPVSAPLCVNTVRFGHDAYLKGTAKRMCVGINNFSGHEKSNICTFDEHEFANLLQNVLFERLSDTRFKSKTSDHVEAKENAKSKLHNINTFAQEEYVKSYSTACENTKAITRGMLTAAQLVNAPANYCNPVTLSAAALRIAKDCGLGVKIFSVKKMQELKMGSALAVGKGSMYPPMFIHLTYKPSTVKKKIAFVGKGVCFDAGGYNIKSAASQIELMKFDMGGAAAVLGAARAIGTIKPNNVQVDFIVPTVENMISSYAYRPGDIITASNGKTIEVGNTDAEGRLILADALIYADNLKPDAIVDIATLTGAILVALGTSVTGLFSNDGLLATQIEQAAYLQGEMIWRMPLVEDYKELLSSKIADINNVGGAGKGGSITAALFLSEFVSKSTPWAHMDIAGSGWDSNEKKSTAHAVRTLTQLALDMAH